jgi:hypothetical protein
MNKKFYLVFAFMFIIFSLGMISASCDSNNCPNQTVTDVKGIIYQGTINNPVSGANVQVTCAKNGPWNYIVRRNSLVSRTNTEITVSNNKGKYLVSFPQTECTIGDKITVTAISNDLVGTATGSITDEDYLGCLNLDLGIVNVPLVPEFGAIAGSLTILGSMTIFFIVRRK